MAELTKEQVAVLSDKSRIADLLKQIEHIAATGQSDDFDGDVGPWMQTPIAKDVKAAWDRGMRLRSMDDSSDIFEKLPNILGQQYLDQ